MAAPVCVCCQEKKSKCFGIFSKKAELFGLRENIQSLFRHDIHFGLLQGTVVCEICLKLLAKVSDIRTNVNIRFAVHYMCSNFRRTI